MKQSLVTLLLVAFSLTIWAQDETTVKKVVLPEGYASQLDVVYAKVKDWEGKIDIYYPQQTTTPVPVVFNIHGGGWNHGDKESQGGFGSFFKAGFAVVNVEYRLVQVATAPAAIEDVRSAILYVVQHAKELNVDPNKIVVMGSSAGGHLALMAGLLQNDHKFDAGYKDVKGFRIAAIIDKYGPADLAVPGIEKNKSAANWLGNHVNDQSFKAAVSPITYVTKTSPPVFIVHGDADPLVPYQQSVDLHQKLLNAGVQTQFITVQGGGHGNFPKDKSKEISEAIISFLKNIGLGK